MLEGKGVYELGQTSIDTLIDMSKTGGHCSAMARSLLILHSYKFETDYVLPGGSEGFVQRPHPISDPSDGIKLYPNPNDGSILNIILPEVGNDEEIQLTFWNGTGLKVITNIFKGSIFEFKPPVDFNGLYIYRISRNGETLSSGRIVFLR